MTSKAEKIREVEKGRSKRGQADRAVKEVQVGRSEAEAIDDLVPAPRPFVANPPRDGWELLEVSPQD